MELLRNLPRELVLLVAEQAARSGVREGTGTAAALCLVSRQIRSVVTPILYHLIRVRNDNDIYAIARSRTSRTPFTHTRAVYFSMDVSEESIRSVYRVFRKPLEFTGEYDILHALVWCHTKLRNTELRLSSAYITDPTSRWPERSCTATVSHLHIVVAVNVEDVSISQHSLVMQAKYLIVDALCGFGDDDVLEEKSISDFLRDMELVLRIGSVRRMLLRSRCSPEEISRNVLGRIAAWGGAQRDPRLWLEDAYVPICDTDGNFVYDSLDLEDAIAGKSLWSTGRQLYVP